MSVNMTTPKPSRRERISGSKNEAFERLAEPLRREIKAPETGVSIAVVTMHDGSTVRFHKTHENYDPTDRAAAYAHVRACHDRNEVATGLLFIDENGKDMHAVSKTVTTPLVDIPFSELCPGNEALQKLMDGYR